ncbi:uncharacterized protein LOC110869212 isoform X2 [Helianthus annuus]|nr:uncharacterized protein LOC110869212 isoform X2 [Helianthus annuus]XP_035831331.1 uncharacterized protein LOC110869212 isoform X2 [Helianthus annuus]
MCQILVPMSMVHQLYPMGITTVSFHLNHLQLLEFDESKTVTSRDGDADENTSKKRLCGLSFSIDQRMVKHKAQWKKRGVDFKKIKQKIGKKLRPPTNTELKSKG